MGTLNRLQGAVTPILDRGWRMSADVRRRVTRSADSAALEALTGGVSRRDVATWTRETEQRRPTLRALVPDVDRSAAIVCVSKRPEMLTHVVQQVRAQSIGCGADPEVLFVANDPSFDERLTRAAFADVPSVRVLAPSGPLELGAALNLAMASTDARFVAKFDDDDLYGPHHLADSLRVHALAGAGVVGKHTYLARVESTGQSLIRFPGHEFSTSGTLAGGSLVIDRANTGDLAFDDISLGEDRAFLKACHRRGISTFSGDRFNFVQMRHASNTWQVPDAAFADGAIEIDERELERSLA